MRELEITNQKGLLGGADIRAFDLEAGNPDAKPCSFKEIKKSRVRKKEHGITKAQFHAILDKASQPIKDKKGDLNDELN